MLDSPTVTFMLGIQTVTVILGIYTVTVILGIQAATVILGIQTVIVILGIQTVTVILHGVHALTGMILGIKSRRGKSQGGGGGLSFFLHTKARAQHLPFTPKTFSRISSTPQKYI